MQMFPDLLTLICSFAADCLLLNKILFCVSGVTIGPNARLWPDQTCFPTPAPEPTNTWKSNTNVCPTVRVPLPPPPAQP